MLSHYFFTDKHFLEGLLLGSLFFSFLYLNKKRKLETIITSLQKENAILEATNQLSKRQESLIDDFKNQLIVSSHTLIKDMQQGAENYFSEKSKNIENILTPVNTTLNSFKERLEVFEKANAEDRGSFKEQISNLIEAEKKLEKETNLLTSILKHPGSRGRWGEIQLERILELSGMQKHCDYDAQVTSNSGCSRADIVIRLPQNRCLIIDAKAPFSDSYLNPEEYDKQDLIIKIKEHVKSLKSKSYWDKFQETPEFVILFLPGESLFNDAIKLSPDLIEASASSNVLLAGPLTLLALLKTVAHTWKQENMQKQIQEISNLGKKLHHRLHVLFNHINKLGKNLTQSTQSYNEMVASLQSRVIPTIKKFEKLEVSSSSHTIKEPIQLDSSPTIAFFECSQD